MAAAEKKYPDPDQSMKQNPTPDPNSDLNRKKEAGPGPKAGPGCNPTTKANLPTVPSMSTVKIKRTLHGYVFEP